METKSIDVEIQGLSPLLMNRFHIDALEEKTKVGLKESTYGTPKEQADKTAYWMSNKKELCIPSEVLFAAMVRASSSFKVGKKSATSSFVSSIIINPNEISLGTSKYEIDARGVVIQSGFKKNRVVRYRAKVGDWKAKFQIQFDSERITAEVIQKILEECGIKIGIMDFRPSNKGTFGRFKINKFEVAK